MEPEPTRESRVFELFPGFTVRAYLSLDDGACVIEFDGHPPDDEDCERVRVYMNDGFAVRWISPGEPGYGEASEAEE